MGYVRGTSRYLEIITIDGPTFISTVDLISIHVKTSKKDISCFLYKEFTKLIYMKS